MIEVLERRIRRYIEGKISLKRFYHWYMQWKCWVNEEGTGIEDNPDEDTRVTLVLYEFTSEPIASDPCREEWLKGELLNILEKKGRWVQKSCRKCKGSGIDPQSHHRYTTGGHDDRSCPACNGEGFTEG